MPIVTVAMFSGRTQTEKDRLAEAITEDIIKILKVEKKEVIVVIQEEPRGNWYASGIRVQDIKGVDTIIHVHWDYCIM